MPKDIPLALHYIELLARMGALEWAPVATKVLARLLKDCDETGVWRPKNLRSLPKPGNKITYHYYPLHLDAKTTEGKEVDITFRLALIAKAAGLVTQLHLSCACDRMGSMYILLPMSRLDLTRFGFTPTESLVYEVLLTSGPGTGYAIARAAGLARANAYSALEGLVAKGAARVEGGRPRRYRPEAPGRPDRTDLP